MDQRIENFVNTKHVAVVGVSKKKFGGTIYKTLKKRGYAVYPVHPTLSSFDGDSCFPRLSDVPDDVEAAVVAVSPAHAADVVDDARKAGLTKLWFQQGADFSGAVRKAEADGLQAVSGKCILLYAPPVTGLHGVHRFLARLFRTW